MDDTLKLDKISEVCPLAGASLPPSRISTNTQPASKRSIKPRPFSKKPNLMMEAPSLLCPMCQPEQVAFTNVRQLKIHLSSTQHFGCFPYQCGTCKTRFAVHEELREHHQRAHGQDGAELAYSLSHAEEKKKQLLVNLVVRHAIAVQEGSAQPADLASTITHYNGNNSLFVVNPESSAAPIAIEPTTTPPETSSAPPHDSNSGGAAELTAATNNPPALPPHLSRKCASESCSATVLDNYSAQRQHVIEAHSAEVELGSAQMQTHLEMLIPMCFPGARIINDMTCSVCEVELKGALERAGEHQSVHVRERHLKETMGLHCPVVACPDHSTIQPNLSALLHHLKHHHEGVLKLERRAADSYRQMRRKALVMADESKSRYFPFTPEIDSTAPNRRNLRHELTNDAAGDGEGEGEPRQKCVRFSADAPRVYTYEPSEDGGEDGKEEDSAPREQEWAESSGQLVIDLTWDAKDEEEDEEEGSDEDE